MGGVPARFCRRAFALQGKKGYVVLVEGVRRGRAILSAKLMGHLYADVPEQQVLLSVREKMEVKPPSVHLIPTSTAPLMLRHIKGAEFTDFTLPHDSFKHLTYGVVDSSIAALDESVITGGDLGVTDVVVEDSTMNYTETHQQPRSVVCVNVIIERANYQPGGWVS